MGNKSILLVIMKSKKLDKELVVIVVVTNVKLIKNIQK